jgi:hypothetical protein
MTQGAAPDSPEIRSLDSQIAQAEGRARWSDVANLLRQRAQRVGPVADKVSTLEHLAGVYRQKLTNEAAAAQTAEEIVRLDAGHASAREYLHDYYGRTGQRDKLAALEASAPGMFNRIKGAVGSAATAVGTAASSVAHAVDEANRNPEWMRQQSAPQPARAASPRCAYCGADLAAGSRSCNACGAEQ